LVGAFLTLNKFKLEEGLAEGDCPEDLEERYGIKARAYRFKYS